MPTAAQRGFAFNRPLSVADCRISYMAKAARFKRRNNRRADYASARPR